MLKRWNRSADKPIKPSFLIEVMALDLVDAPFTTYAREVQQLLAAVPAVLSGPWPDPAELGPHVSDQMTPNLLVQRPSAPCAPRRRARPWAVRLRSAGQDQAEALALWREVMGRYFPTS